MLERLWTLKCSPQRCAYCLKLIWMGQLAYPPLWFHVKKCNIKWKKYTRIKSKRAKMRCSKTTHFLSLSLPVCLSVCLSLSLSFSLEVSFNLYHSLPTFRLASFSCGGPHIPLKQYHWVHLNQITKFDSIRFRQIWGEGWKHKVYAQLFSKLVDYHFPIYNR